jgi:hypothetical protein
MKRCGILALLVLVAGGLTVQAEHATISLRLFRTDPETSRSSELITVSADQEPPAGGVRQRPLCKVKAGEPLVLQFIYLNTYPHGVTKDVRIRYFVARAEKPRQKMLPDLKKGTVTRGEFHLNFKPKSRVGARVAFTAPEPGIYLLRVDSLNTHSDHEHIAAIDLQVE